MCCPYVALPQCHSSTRLLRLVFNIHLITYFIGINKNRRINIIYMLFIVISFHTLRLTTIVKLLMVILIDFTHDHTSSILT